MTWADPTWLWALLAVVAVAAAGLAMARRHRRLLDEHFPGELGERLLPTAVRRRRLLRDVLALGGLVAVVLALAEPRFDKRLREVEAEGVDLVIAVDLSRSMNATDVDPSRLERARREILDLLDLLEGDRVGLVMFAGGAYPRMPLTLDHAALRLLVDELDTRMFQAQGSSMAEGIRSGIELLDDPTAQAGRALLVVSDGESHTPDEALSAAEEAAEAGVAVFALVVGREGARIPRGDGTFLKDPTTGSPVMTVPSTDLLTDIARRTGGAVVRSVASNDDVAQLYTQAIRGQLQAAVHRTQQAETWNSAFQWPLGLGLGLWLAASWLGDGRRRLAQGTAAGLVLLGLLGAPQPAWADAPTLREAQELYDAGRYDEAVEVFTDLSLLSPDDPDLLRRLGAARYRAGDYEGAARAFSREAELTGDADADFNAGNAHFRSGRLDEAIERYDRALEHAPEHPGASRNRELATAERQRRRMEQQQRQRQRQQQPGSGDQEPQQGDRDSSEQPSQGEQGQAGQQQPPQDSQAQSESDAQASPSEGESDAQSSPASAQAEPEGGTDPDSPSDPTQQGEDPSGTREEQGEDGVADLDAIDGAEGQDGEDTEEQGGQASDQGEGDGQGASGGSVTAEQADQTLDGVEEGRPRVYIPGERSRKPW